MDTTARKETVAARLAQLDGPSGEKSERTARLAQKVDQCRLNDARADRQRRAVDAFLRF